MEHPGFGRWGTRRTQVEYIAWTSKDETVVETFRRTSMLMELMPVTMERYLFQGTPSSVFIGRDVSILYQQVRARARHGPRRLYRQCTQHGTCQKPR